MYHWKVRNLPMVQKRHPAISTITYGRWQRAEGGRQLANGGGSLGEAPEKQISVFFSARERKTAAISLAKRMHSQMYLSLIGPLNLFCYEREPGCLLLSPTMRGRMRLSY